MAVKKRIKQKEICGSEQGAGPVLRGIIKEDYSQLHRRGKEPTFILSIGDKKYRLAKTSRDASRTQWLRLRQYAGNPVTVRGDISDGVIYGAEVSLETSDDLKKIESLTILNRSEQIRAVPSTTRYFGLDGRLSRTSSRLHIKDREAVLIGFEGEIQMPGRFDLQYRRGLRDPQQTAISFFAPSLSDKERKDRLEPPTEALDTFQGVVDLVGWSSRSTDKPYYFGAFPSDDPFVLKYLEKLVQAEQLHEIFNLRREVARGAPREDKYTRAGKVITTAVGASEEVLEKWDPMWNGVRATVTASPKTLIRTARCVYDHRVRQEVTHEVLTKELSEVEQRIKQNLRKIEKDDPYTRNAVIGLLGGVSIAAAGTYAAIKIPGPPQLKAAMFGAGLLGGILFAGLYTAGASANDFERRGRRLGELGLDLSAVREIKEKIGRERRESTYGRTIENIIDIMGEDDERIKRELEIANSPEEKERVYKIIKYRLEHQLKKGSMRLRLGQRNSMTRLSIEEAVEVFGKAIRNRDKQQMAEVMLGICEHRNLVFQESRKTMEARTDNLVEGFATLSITSPKKQPDWMWL